MRVTESRACLSVESFIRRDVGGIACLRAYGSRAAAALLCGSLLSLTVTGDGRALYADDLLQSQEITAVWDGQRSEVATASIRFLCFNGSIESPGLSAEELRQLLRDHDFAADAEQFRPFLLSVLGGSFRLDPPWAEMQLDLAGRRQRQEDGRLTFLRDGEHDFIVLPANHQVSVYPLGQSWFHCYGLSDLRWVPPPPMPPERIRVLGRDGDAWQVEFVAPAGDSAGGTSSTALVDDATGIMLHTSTLSAAGLPLKERYHLGVRTYPGDISFPVASVQAWYAAGRLSKLRVMLIQEARFNESIPDSRFVLPAAQGTSLIDHRGTATAGFQTKADVSDVRGLISPVAVLPPRAPHGQSDRGAGRWLLLINGVLLVGAGFVIWRRRRAAHQ